MRLDNLLTRSVPTTAASHAVEMQARINRLVKCVNDVNAKTAGMSADVNETVTPSLASHYYQLRFVGARSTAGEKDCTHVSVQQAAQTTEALTWMQIAVEDDTLDGRLNHIYLCFEQRRLRLYDKERVAECRWLRYDHLTMKALVPPTEGSREKMLQDFLLACKNPDLTDHFPIVFLGQLETEDANETTAKFCSDPSAWTLGND